MSGQFGHDDEPLRGWPDKMRGIARYQSKFTAFAGSQHGNVVGLNHSLLDHGVVKSLPVAQDIDCVASLQAVKVAEEGVAMTCDHRIAVTAWNSRPSHVSGPSQQRAARGSLDDYCPQANLRDR